MNQMPEQRGGIGLALSGGGFRGLLFHLGGAWRLNELGWLRRIGTFSGISGGSIIAALMGLNWRKLEFSESGVARRFTELIADPVRRFCSLNLDLLPTLLNGLLNNFGLSSSRISSAYRRHLFGDATMADLPGTAAGPRVIVNTCNLVSGAAVRITQSGAHENGVCLLAPSNIKVADAVAASSAYPPFLSPVVLMLKENQPGPTNPAVSAGGGSANSRLVLADGALNDPLGLEAIWDENRVLLVSDATTMLAHWPRHTSNWFRQLNRAVLIQCDASSLMQRRHLLHSFAANDADCSRHGAYWCNSALIADHGAPDALAADSELTAGLGTMRTRLNHFTPREQGMLINWGYAMCDAALRSRGLSDAGPGALPFPEFKL